MILNGVNYSLEIFLRNGTYFLKVWISYDINWLTMKEDKSQDTISFKKSSALSYF